MIRYVLAGMMSLLAVLPARAADSVMFQMGWIPGGYNSPYYLGVHAGLFAAEGLDVKVFPGRGSTDTLTKLATNVADFGECGLDIVMTARANSPLPVTGVMSMFTKAPDSLVTTTTSGIASLKDVVGKTVATSPFTSSNLAWPVILKANGVDPASVKLIKVDNNALIGMLAAGQTDAIIMWTTTAPAALPALTMVGKTPNIIPWSGYGFDGYAQVIVASDKTLAERPDVSRRFLKALRQSFLLMRDKPDLAVEAVRAAAPQIDVPATRAQVDMTLLLMFNEITERDGLGVFKEDLVKKTWGWVARANEFPADKLDPMTTITTKYSGS